MTDVHKLLAISKIAVAPSPTPNASLNFSVAAGEGARFDAGTQWLMVWPDGVDPSWAAGAATGGNFEVVRCTSRAADAFTLASRAQKGTTARAIAIGDQVAQIIMPDDVISPASSQSTPADPAATTSATELMMGLAGSITPNSPRILVIITGETNKSTTQTATLQIRHGTGGAPANGAAVVGTADGKKMSISASNKLPFCCAAIVTGLTVGTAYWLDLAWSVGGGTSLTVLDVTIIAFDYDNQGQ